MKAFAAAVIFSATSLLAQDITGDWQGTLKAGTQELRTILTFDKAADGTWKALYRPIGLNPDWGAGLQADSVALQGGNLKVTIALVGASYEGKVSPDGASFEGNWMQGRTSPLELRRATPETLWKDQSTHHARLIPVDKDVQLEVLDWGGSGRPLVLLTGLGNTSHIYDKFALKLTPAYHVYGITRRGYGASSAPASGYEADRLGDDVLAVLDALKLSKPVLAAHSIGGEELSSIGSRHPGRVAGLIYLDAGYSHAYYEPALEGAWSVDLAELQGKMDRLWAGEITGPLIGDLLKTTLPEIERDLRRLEKDLPPLGPQPNPQPAPPPLAAAPRGIMAGQQKYTAIKGPVLAIFAMPDESREPLAKAFETGVPSAKVVRIPHANHYVFLSNEADVLREMNAFIATLP